MEQMIPVKIDAKKAQEYKQITKKVYYSQPSKKTKAVKDRYNRILEMASHKPVKVYSLAKKMDLSSSGAYYILQRLTKEGFMTYNKGHYFANISKLPEDYKVGQQTTVIESPTLEEPSYVRPKKGRVMPKMSVAAITRRYNKMLSLTSKRPMTAAQIAEVIGLSKPGAYRALEKMTEHNYLTRRGLHYFANVSTLPEDHTLITAGHRFSSSHIRATARNQAASVTPGRVIEEVEQTEAPRVDNRNNRQLVALIEKLAREYAWEVNGSVSDIKAFLEYLRNKA